MSRVGVIFGSRSVEHEVSVITAHQALAAMPPQHTAVAVYIAKDGRWFTGAALSELRRFSDVGALLAECTQVTPLLDPPRATLTLAPVEAQRRGLFSRGGTAPLEVDVAMPLVHGSHGEDGTLQGLLEMAGIPFTGSGVAASALTMDKHLAKAVLRDAGLPVLDHVVVDRGRWQRDGDSTIADIESRTTYPVFVKPATLGSSIGVSQARDRGELRDALTVALTYDERCLVERALEDIVEVNCAVIGDGADARPSLLEQPVSSGLLSYDDKYRAKAGGSAGMKSAQRLVPAPLDEDLAERIRAAALAAFAAVGASGVARVDLIVEPAADRFVVNELNPIPGSLAQYLFEPAGLSFPDMLAELIDIATARHRRRGESTAVFDRWMLDAAGPKSAG